MLVPQVLKAPFKPTFKPTLLVALEVAGYPVLLIVGVLGVLRLLVALEASGKLDRVGAL